MVLITIIAFTLATTIPACRNCYRYYRGYHSLGIMAAATSRDILITDIMMNGLHLVSAH